MNGLLKSWFADPRSGSELAQCIAASADSELAA
jgi:hypothetical protein